MQHTNLTLEQKMRAGHVRRWHIVAMVREQTIAEHMYRVQLLTEALLKAMGVFNWDSSLTLNCMEWARVHDLPEVVVGDMPSNAKEVLQNTAHDIAHNSQRMVEDIVDTDIADLRRCVQDPGHPLAGMIVKLADTVEAADYISQYGVGKHAGEVHRRLCDEAARQLVALLHFESWISDRALQISRVVEPFIDGLVVMQMGGEQP